MEGRQSHFPAPAKFILLFDFRDFIYLFMRDTEREAETKAEGEAGSLSDAGLGPRTLGSPPELRQMLNG